MVVVGWFEVGFAVDDAARAEVANPECRVTTGFTPSQASLASCSPGIGLWNPAAGEALEVPFKHPAATRGRAVGPVEKLLMNDHPFANTSLPLTRCQPDMGESRELLSHDPNEKINYVPNLLHRVICLSAKCSSSLCFALSLSYF
jgi:hypothetical protein